MKNSKQIILINYFRVTKTKQSYTNLKMNILIVFLKYFENSEKYSKFLRRFYRDK